MKPINFIKKVIIFIIFSFLIYILGIILYGEFVPPYYSKNIFNKKETAGFSHTRFNQVDTLRNIDILFLGSSRSYRHYDTRKFEKIGFSVFNLGSGGQTFKQTEVLVSRYLDQLNPALVILDIYSGMFSLDGIESSLDILINDTDDKFSRKLVWNEQNAMILNTWLYNFYKNSLSDKTYKDPEDSLSTYISGGFVERKVTHSKEVLKVFHKWKIKPSQWSAFKNIIRKINRSRANLILITSPYQSTIEMKKNDQLKKFLKNKNIKFLDYSHALDLNDTLDFYDPFHMNQNGVEIFNDLIIKDLFK